MLTPTSNVVRLFYNEKCKGCENAVWIAVPRFYYATPDYCPNCGAKMDGGAE